MKTRAEVKHLDVGTRVYFRRNGPDTKGTIVGIANWKFKVKWDDGFEQDGNLYEPAELAFLE